MNSQGSQIFDLVLPPFELEMGQRLQHHNVRGWWWGPLDDHRVLEARTLDVRDYEPTRVIRRRAADQGALKVRAQQQVDRAEAPHFDGQVPTVLLVHSLTCDMRAGGDGGWWAPLIGHGKPFDPRHVRLICFNNLGSCYGTSGPADEGFPRRHGTPELAAAVTPWDMARSILLALDALGISQIDLVIGGSLGGMVSLCLAILAPERFLRLVPIAAAEASSAWVIGLNHIQRQAIMLDPGFPHGISRGLEVARQIATLSYRAEPGCDATLGRTLWGERRTAGQTFGSAYRMQHFLEHEGRKFVGRFDAHSYLALLEALDHHDVSRRPKDAQGAVWGLDRISASTLCVGVDSDQLFFPDNLRQVATKLAERGVWSGYTEIKSPHGHDAFLMEWAPLRDIVLQALTLPEASSGQGVHRDHSGIYRYQDAGSSMQRGAVS